MAATELFLDKGYDLTGLSEIARRAGLTTGAIYSTYGSKLELLKAVVTHVTDPATFNSPHETFRRPPDDAPLEELYDLMAHAFSTFTKSEDVRRINTLHLEFLLQGMRDPDLLEELRATRRAAIKDNAAVLERYAAEGHQLPMAAEEIAAVVLALIPGLELAQFLLPESVPESLYSNVLRLLSGLPAVTTTGRSPAVVARVQNPFGPTATT